MPHLRFEPCQVLLDLEVVEVFRRRSFLVRLVVRRSYLEVVEVFRRRSYLEVVEVFRRRSYLEVVEVFRRRSLLVEVVEV